MKNDLAVFENHQLRRNYDEETETWLFSVVDIVHILTEQPDYQTARKYWNKLKERLKKAVLISKNPVAISLKHPSTEL